MPTAWVKDYLRGAKTRRRLHLVSLDPCRHDLETLPDKIRRIIRAGADGLLLGGSTGVDRQMVESFTRIIRQALNESEEPSPRPPLILFPSSAQTGLVSLADAVLFLSLLNTTDVRFLIREQTLAAPFLRQMGLEAVGCGMIVFEPGGAVGRVGRAELLRPDAVDAAVGYATAAEAFGFPFVYLNAGSGSNQPVRPEIIRAVSAAIRVPLIVGGGLTDPEKATRAVEAGADILVTGTAIESCADVETTVFALSTAVHSHLPSGMP